MERSTIKWHTELRNVRMMSASYQHTMTCQHTIRTLKIKLHKSTYAVCILIFFFFFFSHRGCFAVSAEDLITAFFLAQTLPPKRAAKARSSIWKEEKVRRPSETGTVCKQEIWFWLPSLYEGMEPCILLSFDRSQRARCPVL